MGWYTIACRDNDPPPLNAGPGIAYGVDGCGAGWFGYGLTGCGERRYRIALTFEELVSSADNEDRFFVDIPIGLPKGSEGRLCGKEDSKVRPCCDPKACEVRRCDKDARDALGSPRSSSVFSAPVCAALYAKTYDRCEPNQPGGEPKGHVKADLRAPAENQGSRQPAKGEREDTEDRSPRGPP